MLNNKKKFLAKKLKLGLVLCFIVSSWSAQAAIDVIDGNDSDTFYGNARTRQFDDVVEGNDTISNEERSFLSAVQATRITDRWYGRFLIGHPKVKLVDLQNNSSYPNDFWAVAFPTYSDNLYQYLFAGGHLWQNWGVELELLFSRQLNYYAMPFLVGRIDQVNATVKQFAALINVQYVIPRWFSFYPQRMQIHLDAGAGPAFKSTNMNAVSFFQAVQTDSASESTLAAAGMLGVGIRYQVSPSFLVDLNYRFYDLGKANFGPITLPPNPGCPPPPPPPEDPLCALPNMKFQSENFRQSGFYIGATYQV